MTSPLTKGAEPMSKSEGVDGLTKRLRELSEKRGTPGTRQHHATWMALAAELVEAYDAGLLVAEPDPRPTTETTISRKALHAAMDAFYPGEDWRNDLGIALETSLTDMSNAIAAALAATPDPAVSSASDGDLFDRQPDLKVASLEPSLRTVLRSYYRPWFSEADADRLTERYIAALRSPTAEVAGELKVLQRLCLIQARELKRLDPEGQTPADLDAAMEALRSTPTAEVAGEVVVPAGWRLVPCEPVPEMLGAFWRVKNTGSTEPAEFGDDRSDYAAYRAMLAAAPVPPEPARPVAGEDYDPKAVQAAFDRGLEKSVKRLGEIVGLRTPSPLSPEETGRSGPDGWQLVPIEPPESMLITARERVGLQVGISNKTLANYYAELLAAAPKPPSSAGLTLTALHAANIARQAEWCPDQVPDLSFRGNELAGETGEACNVIKKLERERQGWRGSRATLADLAEELADVVICADLCAVTAGIDLDAAVVAKFNATSDKVGISVRLAAPSPHTAETETGR